MKKYPKFDGPPPSEEFIESLGCGVGSIELTCSCGRVHVCPDSEYLEDEMVTSDELEAQKAANPDGVVIHRGVDGVGARMLNGQDWVLECPCNMLAKYEAFIWNDRDVIRSYLKRRTAALAEAAKREVEKENDGL